MLPFIWLTPKWLPVTSKPTKSSLPFTMTRQLHDSMSWDSVDLAVVAVELRDHLGLRDHLEPTVSMEWTASMD